jgi:superfamily II DNA or RNA helicase/diadenosine tetraphosphate (Ap4A) HIT family hydrolase/SOS-response transcriptional repressor LexA
MSCFFCDLSPERIVHESDLVFAIRDGYAVTPGHTLVIPKRHFDSWFDATPEEREAIWDVVAIIKSDLDERYSPDGFNIGINVGTAAGQTVMHLHVHVIPRHVGDVDDPSGGVRFVIPSEGNWKRPGFIPSRPPRDQVLSVGGSDPFARHIQPLFERATSITIVAAFAQGSGVEFLTGDINTALDRGAHIRVLTGDYLNITQQRALQQLLDWSTTAGGDEESSDGTFEVRVIESRKLKRAFHPKAWRFEGPDFGVVFVGSSNLSESALTIGVEWNLRLERARDREGYQQVVDAFAPMWKRAKQIDQAWVDAYEERVQSKTGIPDWLMEIEPDSPQKAFEPHLIQREALDTLQLSREEGRKRALMVLATGLGKTWLSVFDLLAVAEELGHTPRLLFIAHRRELLGQALRTFRKSFPKTRMGWCAGRFEDLEAEFVFASVQKLSQPAHLKRLTGQHFDYAIIDEVHHAHADSYRKVLAALNSDFLLGLTATPDRADDGDVLGLFDDHQPYRADLGRGIDDELLVPFRYWGIQDTVDYAPIPWRNRRFKTAELVEHVATQARMKKLWEAWKAHPGARTLVFCASVEHSNFVSRWLTEQGVRSASVHSGKHSDNRATALDRLSAGELDALCCVDLFNEGIDVPKVDRVVMLRPTESRVIFLQQLGRGLRRAEGKTHLDVIDFVGNHAVFLDRVRQLLSLSGARGNVAGFVTNPDSAELPAGCQIDIEVGAIDLLKKLLPKGKAQLMRSYRELRELRGTRPSPSDLWRLDLNPNSDKRPWFELVADEEDLLVKEASALELAAPWLQTVQRTHTTKSFKLVVLHVLIERGWLFTPVDWSEFCTACHEYLCRIPGLFADLEGVKRLPNPRQPDPALWESYWFDNPVEKWTATRWFTREDGVLRFTLNAPDELRPAIVHMTAELVDWLLARYRQRTGTIGGAFTAKLIQNSSKNPIIQVATARKRFKVPMGDTTVRLENGDAWIFRFVKIAVNTARPVGAASNELPDLLRSWFGPDAGKPGTEHIVRFSPSPNGLWIEPMGQVLQMPARGSVVAFPTLRAAAGHESASTLEIEPDEVRLPVPTGDGLFAVRADGDSMDGGKNPIRSGDWVVLRWARGKLFGAVENRVALFERGDVDVGPSYHLKRLVKSGSEYVLLSDNPGVGPIPADAATQLIALHVQTVRPEDLAPPEGTHLTGSEIQKRFDLSREPSGKVDRVDGHLFLFLTETGDLEAADRARVELANARPAETAFVMSLSGDQWRYAGVGRLVEGLWAFPNVDFHTFRRLGTGRGASRRLPANWEDRARTWIDKLLIEATPGTWLVAGERRCRIEGRSAKGGVRVSGGNDGFKARTVSVLDVAWVLETADHVRLVGGVLDESRVNRRRYLEGTPKKSTRWIDTGWALALVSSQVAEGGETRPQ